jgi:hypothetical protein
MKSWYMTIKPRAGNTETGIVGATLRERDEK